jgi:hypothetical protein
MIGTRATASAGLAILAVAALLAPRATDPATEIGAHRVVRQRGADTIAALDALRQAIEPGLDAARVAAAAVVSGDGPPADRIVAAADLIALAEDAVVPARRAVASLSGARIAWRAEADPLPAPIEIGELSSIGAQLRAAGPAGDAFVEIRLRSDGLPAILEDALRALDRRDVAEAERLAARARSDYEAVAAWDTDLPTLPVWLDTTDAMIRAVEEILAAVHDGDPAAASVAAQAFASLREEGATADRALRIALGEGGSALTATPLQRLAAALGRIEDARAAVEAAIDEASP